MIVPRSAAGGAVLVHAVSSVSLIRYCGGVVVFVVLGCVAGSMMSLF